MQNQAINYWCFKINLVLSDPIIWATKQVGHVLYSLGATVHEYSSASFPVQWDSNYTTQ